MLSLQCEEESADIFYVWGCIAHLFCLAQTATPTSPTPLKFDQLN